MTWTLGPWEPPAARPGQARPGANPRHFAPYVANSRSARCFRTLLSPAPHRLPIVRSPSQYRSTSNPGLEVLRYWDGGGNGLGRQKLGGASVQNSVLLRLASLVAFLGQPTTPGVVAAKGLSGRQSRMGSWPSGGCLDRTFDTCTAGARPSCPLTASKRPKRARCPRAGLLAYRAGYIRAGARLVAVRWPGDWAPMVSWPARRRWRRRTSCTERSRASSFPSCIRIRRSRRRGNPGA